jgi:hypothetical protein
MHFGGMLRVQLIMLDHTIRRASLNRVDTPPFGKTAGLRGVARACQHNFRATAYVGGGAVM